MAHSRTYIAIPPGATIREQLVERGMLQKEFAVRMDITEKHASKLINGEVQLTPDMAVRLENVLGVPTGFWLNLEAIYREKLAKVHAENSIDQDVPIARMFPYAEMANLGWVPKTRDVREKVVNLRHFFGVVRLDLIVNRQITQVACKRLTIKDRSDIALIAWVQQAKNISKDTRFDGIDIQKLNRSVDKIMEVKVSGADNFVDRLKALLAGCGIDLVFLPYLKGSFLHGASFVDGNKIIIAMADIGKDVNKFWSGFFHEIGHIVLGHVKKLDGTTEEDEVAAEMWASEIVGRTATVR